MIHYSFQAVFKLALSNKMVMHVAGAGILYDSRMYHRAPPELNVSGQMRWAMLTCIVPSYVPSPCHQCPPLS
eukprot:COSAG03_NODE_2575_length_2631_cov_8.169431_2_plen_71_part_01